MTALVGLGLGTLLGAVLARRFLTPCQEAPVHLARRQAGCQEVVGEVAEDSACRQFVCFHALSREKVEDAEELRGCLILVKARKSEQVVKFDAAEEEVVTYRRKSEKVVVLREWEECDVRDGRPWVHRRLDTG